jgi:septum site-determining protein MinC
MKLSVEEQPRVAFRLLGRSFLAFVLVPEQPFDEWLLELDRRMDRSPSFFTNRPVIIDLAGATPTQAETADLIHGVEKRNLRLLAVEGANRDWLPPQLAPLPGALQSPGLLPPIQEETRVASRKKSMRMQVEKPSVIAPGPSSLLIAEPVRSGQTILHPQGDVTVIGSIASGAEVISGGSIHVYGALRGRAIAGASGNSAARIFCNRFEAEILVIDGFYKTADDFDPKMRGAPVQARLEHECMTVETLN